MIHDRGPAVREPDAGVESVWKPARARKSGYDNGLCHSW